SVGYALLARNLDRQATAGLTQAAEDQVDRIKETGRITAPPDTDAPSSSATRLAVYRSDGTIVGERSDVPGWLRPHGTRVGGRTVAGERVRLVTLRASTGGGAVAVVAGRSLEPE